jgi:hypothetical protein
MTDRVLTALQNYTNTTRGDTWSLLYQALLTYTGRTEGHINNLLIKAWLDVLGISGPYDYNILQYLAADSYPLKTGNLQEMAILAIFDQVDDDPSDPIPDPD